MDPAPPIVCKFGGTSLADADQIRKVAAIIASDPRRRFIVPSAPGKRFDADVKVTDLLYSCYDAKPRGDIDPSTFSLVEGRFRNIASDLGVLALMDRDLNRCRRQFAQPVSRDFMASRGEYLTGRMLAAFLGATFVDPADAIKIAGDGTVLPESYQRLAERLQGEGLFVIAGFYGSDLAGLVKTFTRGGSDLSGSIVARAVGAAVYENWTDVPGLLTADPRIVPGARPVREVTYRELRELTHMGATVLHDEAVFPLRDLQIPIRIRNTNAPNDPGTRATAQRESRPSTVIAIAGMTGFTSVTAHKPQIHCAVQPSLAFLSAVGGRAVSIETGVDSISVILREDDIGKEAAGLEAEIRRTLDPEGLEITGGLALIAIVGQGIASRVGVAAQALRALAKACINVRLMTHCPSGISLIVGVASADFTRSIRSLHNEFVDVASTGAGVAMRPSAPRRRAGGRTQAPAVAGSVRAAFAGARDTRP